MNKKAWSIIFGIFLISTFTTECNASYLSDFIAPGSWTRLEKPSLIGLHEVLTIANNLDEQSMSGEKILLYRLSPHAIISEVARHDTWEEVVITEGQLAWLNQDETQSVQTVLEVGSYVNRAPYVPHGPFRAGPDGCQMFVRYYY
ncbi:MAG TPA: hypothetical protein VEL47_00210 [Myxococcota bacterium]|nr:hypothetical protein [Myxococcota bacterium]